MKKIRALFFIATGILILNSCKKEYSLENAGSHGLPVDTTGNTCAIDKIVVISYVTKLVEYAFTSTYTSDHKVSSIQLTDSLTNNVDNTFVVTHTPGRIQVDTEQYFLTGADGKVTEFHGYEFPEDPSSDRFTVKYTYNAAGQLVKRLEEYDIFPGVTSFEMDYSYTANNLTRTEAKVNNGITMQTFINVTYEYETTKFIKNYIYQNSVAPEIFYFQTAINAGQISVNPLVKATTIFKDYNSGRDSTTVSNFLNYQYDTKGHVTSFQLTGDDFAVNNFYTGKKYVFSYSCY